MFTKEEAINQWNQRPRESQIRREVVEQIRKEVYAKSKPMSYRDSEDMGMISRWQVDEILDSLLDGGEG